MLEVETKKLKKLLDQVKPGNIHTFMERRTLNY